MPTYTVIVVMTTCHSFAITSVKQEDLATIASKHLFRGAVEIRVRREALKDDS